MIYQIQDFIPEEQEALSKIYTKFPLSEDETKAIEQILTAHDIKKFSLFDTVQTIDLIDPDINCICLCVKTQPSQTSPTHDLSQISLSEDRLTQIQGDYLNPVNLNNLYVMGAIATKNLCEFSIITDIEVNSPHMTFQQHGEVSDGVKFFVKYLSDALNMRKDPPINLTIGRDTLTHESFIDMDLEKANITKLKLVNMLVRDQLGDREDQTDPRFSIFLDHLTQNKKLKVLDFSYHHNGAVDKYMANESLHKFLRDGGLNLVNIGLPDCQIHKADMAAIIDALSQSKDIIEFVISNNEPNLIDDQDQVEESLKNLLRINNCLTLLSVDANIEFNIATDDNERHELHYFALSGQLIDGSDPDCPSDTMRANFLKQNNLKELCQELQRGGAEGFSEFCEQIKQLGYTLPRVHQLIRNNEELVGTKLAIESYYKLLKSCAEIIDSRPLQEILFTEFEKDSLKVKSQVDIDKVLRKLLLGKYDFTSLLPDLSKNDLESILDKIFNYEDKNLSIQDPDSYKQEEDIIKAQKYVKILIDAKIKEHPKYSEISESHRIFIDRFSSKMVISDAEGAIGFYTKRPRIGDDTPASTISASSIPSRQPSRS